MGEARDAGYRFLDHVTDAFVEAWGPSMESAFEQAAITLFETMMNVEKVEVGFTEIVFVEGHDEMELLYNWLEALLLKFEVDQKALSRFNVQRIELVDGSWRLTATVGGTVYDPARHGQKVEVKGVTYHLMTVEKQARSVTVRFLLDL